jgi:hypothetical protein
MDIAAIDRDVTGQFSEIGNPESQAQKEADHEDEATDDDEQLADLGHESIVRAARRLDLAAGSRVG